MATCILNPDEPKVRINHQEAPLAKKNWRYLYSPNWKKKLMNIIIGLELGKGNVYNINTIKYEFFKLMYAFMHDAC